MRVVDLGAAKQILTDLRARAEAAPMSLEMVRALAEGRTPPEDLNTELTVTIPHGVVVSFTLETQAQGLLRHLSVSVSGPHMPHPLVVEEMMPFLGFVNGLWECKTWIEDCRDGTKAINVLEPEDGDWTPFLKSCSPREVGMVADALDQFQSRPRPGGAASFLREDYLRACKEVGVAPSEDLEKELFAHGFRVGDA